MSSEISWDAVVLELGPTLFRYFCATFPPFIADELTQDTLCRLFDKVNAGGFDAAKGNLRMYAFGISHFIRLEHLRSRPAASESSDAEPFDERPGVDERLHQEREVWRLRQAIKQLPETQQQILSLYLYQELTLDQIGAITNSPVGTIKSHIHRAKEALKIALQEENYARPR